MSAGRAKLSRARTFPWQINRNIAYYAVPLHEIYLRFRQTTGQCMVVKSLTGSGAEQPSELPIGLKEEKSKLPGYKSGKRCTEP